MLLNQRCEFVNYIQHNGTANNRKISLTYVKVDRKTDTIPLVSIKKTVQHPQTDLNIKAFENGCTLGNPEPRSENTCTSGNILDQNNSPICPAKHSKLFGYLFF